VATVNLNKLASELVGLNTKVRVRLVEREVQVNEIFTTTMFELQIRPTTRGTAIGLPKGEMLIDLRNKKQGSGTTKRFTLPVFRSFTERKALPLGNFSVTPTKHGWLVLAVCDTPVLVPGKAQPAGGSVSDK
jgi:hypothetical protein